MNNQKRIRNVEILQQVENEEEKQDSQNSQEDEKFDTSLEEKIHNNEAEPQEQIGNNPEKYVVEIPSHAKKQDLHELKSFLLEQEK
jgi:hypothetical protein